MPAVHSIAYLVEAPPSASLDVSQPYGPPLSVTGIDLLFIYAFMDRCAPH
jgi:hypothetical protein